MTPGISDPYDYRMSRNNVTDLGYNLILCRVNILRNPESTSQAHMCRRLDLFDKVPSYSYFTFGGKFTYMSSNGEKRQSESKAK
jgi:hypothetical protein